MSTFNRLAAVALVALLAFGGLAHADGITNPSVIPAIGQLPGTATNDNAAAGSVGEYVVSSSPGAVTATVTITIATPGVVTWTGNIFAGYVPIRFTTTGALPTGITAGTVYYTSCPTVAGSSACTDNFKIATSLANAIAGTYVNTSGSQSGVQTGDNSMALTTGTIVDIAAISLTPGDWDIWLFNRTTAAITTVVNTVDISISTASVTRQGPLLAVQTPYVGNGVAPVSLLVGPLRASISTTTSYFGVLRANFGTSTMNTDAVVMRARRVR